MIMIIIIIIVLVHIVLFVACGLRHRAVWYVAIVSILCTLQPTTAVFCWPCIPV